MVKPPADLRARGERHGGAKLSEHDVREIRRRFEAGETFRSLAEAFNVSTSCIGLVLHRRCWAHVE